MLKALEFGVSSFFSNILGILYVIAACFSILLFFYLFHRANLIVFLRLLHSLRRIRIVDQL